MEELRINLPLLVRVLYSFLQHYPEQKITIIRSAVTCLLLLYAFWYGTKSSPPGSSIWIISKNERGDKLHWPMARELR
jgi:hypothetical protein